MKHQMNKKKLGRSGSHKAALLRNMADSLITHERIKTTLVKAKVLKSYTEKVLTLSKKSDLASKRDLINAIRTKGAFEKLTKEFAQRFASVKSGYLRIIKLPAPRKGDGADMAYLEFVDFVPKPAKVKTEKKADAGN